ncbi:serine/threonine-protein phosphatase, partial [Streptomyces sp. SID10116]|nr:serine/threonine-protein phosphatase [Streptomyces sp. SID10116]
FFPLRAALTDAVRVAPVSPQGVVHAVYDRLLRHTGHLPSDDAALLVLRNDRTRVPSQQREAARAARPAMELSGRRRDERRR